MHLNAANVAHFLIGRGLLSPESVVRGDLTILDSSRRNRNFRVIRDGTPSLFIKQMRDAQPDAMMTLRREAACYERARDDPALSRLMPRLIAYDSARHLLIVELLPDAESLADRYVRERTLPVEIGRMLGEALGVYHARAAIFAESESERSLFERHVPVVLAWRSRGHAAIGQQGAVGREISSIVRQHPEFETLLDVIGVEWRFDSLIHSDMKWDNVLVFPTSSGELDFRIVDWEMADLGDADWDVGAILQSFLTVWIQSMPVASGLPPERYVAMAAEPIELMRPALQAFWRAYAETRGFAEAERGQTLERSMRFAAGRLVWSAFEQRVHAKQLDAASLALLQVSFNILRDPAQAVRDLLSG
jgi:Ser/Thr protein kinase RdoA (MazF antagonist)